MTEDFQRGPTSRGPFRRPIDWVRGESAAGRPWWTGPGQQSLPVNMYETDVDLLIVAAMPGIRAEDIEITVTGQTLTIRSEMRGSMEETKDYLRREWYYGPYRRTLELPFPVDADKANANYGAGVLTLSLPKSGTSRSHRIVLTDTGLGKGEAEGHGGMEFSPDVHEEKEAKERAPHDL